MTWQAFLDITFRMEEDLTYDVALQPSFAEAKRVSLSREAVSPYGVNQDCRLRRLSWKLDPGLEVDGELVRLPMETVVKVAVLGQDRSIAWPSPLDLPVIRCGSGLFFRMKPSGLLGRAVLTFDFEGVEDMGTSLPGHSRYSRG